MTIVTQNHGVGSESPNVPDGSPTPESVSSERFEEGILNANDGSNLPAREALLSPSALLPTKDEDEEHSSCNDPDQPSISHKPKPFPIQSLVSLEEKISHPRWVIPVQPNEELENLLKATIELCRTGDDKNNVHCERFMREAMTTCINRITTDEAISGWRHGVLQCIYENCLKFIEICVLKLEDDWIQLSELLAIVLNPYNKFHSFNNLKQSETIDTGIIYNDDYLFARPLLEPRASKGWLVDMLNKYGEFGGFKKLRDRFTSEKPMTLTLLHTLIKPFGWCADLLTEHTISTYFQIIIECIPNIIRKLSDDELKREAKNESKNDLISSIIKSCRSLLQRLQNQEEKIKELEMFRLEMLLRLLQISSFNGKMNALNEVNKLITGIGYYPTRHHSNIDNEIDEWLTSEKMAKWIKENNVLEIVLRDSLHQPQYVEKLEKILRFLIKEKALTLDDLDSVWSAQAGKHDTIVKNVHDLLAKLAWDFTPEQLDHLFSCFQSSWSTASKKQTEKLLELIRRLAEDDKNGDMADKVLNLFWNLAHKEDVLPEILDQALSAHVKILDYSCSQDRDSQKPLWIDKCIAELRNNDNWVVPALKLIKDICSLYDSHPSIGNPSRQNMHYRQEMIEKLQKRCQLVVLISNNLAKYTEFVRQVKKKNPGINANTYYPDGKYNHIQQIQDRLNFLRFLLKEGRLFLHIEQARSIWECLAEKSVFECDREACFRWFSKLMGETPDLNDEIYTDFFKVNILQFDPALLTESGMKCFERFFKIVNSKNCQKPSTPDHRASDMDLIGTDYLWRVLTNGNDLIANRAIELLKEVYTNLNSRLQTASDFHETHISECLDRLRCHYDNIALLSRDNGPKKDISDLSVKMCRVLRVLYEYINECDDAAVTDRNLLPLCRASQGKTLLVYIRYAPQGRQIDDINLATHGNVTIGNMRKDIWKQIKSFLPNFKMDLIANNEILDAMDDKRLLSEIPCYNKDKLFLTAKLTQGNGNVVSSPDSSSDSSIGSSHHLIDPSSVDDDLLPGVIIARNDKYVRFLFQIADKGCELGDSNLYAAARNILRIVPANQKTVENLCCFFGSRVDSNSNKEYALQVPSLNSLFFGPSSTEILYNIEVLYTLLLPAYEDKNTNFQLSFLCNKESHVVLEMFTKNNFLPNADVETKRNVFLSVLRICNALLSMVCYVLCEPKLIEYFNVELPSDRIPSNRIEESFVSYSQQTEGCVRYTSIYKPIQKFVDEIRGSDLHSLPTSLLEDAFQYNAPNPDTIRAIIRLAWCSAGGNVHLLAVNSASIDDLHEALVLNEPDEIDITICREALELVTLCSILNVNALSNFMNENWWNSFIIDLVLCANNRLIRYYAVDQLSLMLSFSNNSEPSSNCVSLLFKMLHNDVVTENGSKTYDYFILLKKLLNVPQVNGIPNIVENLDAEIQWLNNAKESTKKYGDMFIDEVLLEGHLGVIKELFASLTPIQRSALGNNDKYSFNIIKELIEDFIFPASNLALKSRMNNRMIANPGKQNTMLEKPTPVCNSSQTIEAAFDLLVTLCLGVPRNLKLVVGMLCDMFYFENDNHLVDWEYLPPVGPRHPTGFVGLKNAGATCYMNSVIQQLFMIENIKSEILAAEGTFTDPNEEFLGDERFDVDNASTDTVDNDDKNNNGTNCVDDIRKKYNINILKEMQVIFAHLACSKMQFYVPKGLWRNFRLQGEPVNLREQQDAVEFFMNLVESVDEGLKTLNQEQIMNKILGGLFSDQKICKTCPHRYCREEPFSVISVDMRNHSNLLDSLEQYVKGELLEGTDAYHCDKCDKKVVTVKRLCVKKLPPVLTIQLKRFEYDFERVCAIKFNDYFEFPRNLDMEPYTVSGLAKVEGEMIDCDSASPSEEQVCTKYHLTGIVVHSGQASGGHYYSYILHRQKNGTAKWFKFDDGEVSECKMDDDEEMKIQCFGGEYMGEVFDQIQKRMNYRRQKRWWNAYMLFYTRTDIQDKPLVNDVQRLSLADIGAYTLKMPEPIEKCVIKMNTIFMHTKNQFCPEYFNFMKKIIQFCAPPKEHILTNEDAEISLYAVQIVSKFLFTTGFHTKKILRGAVSDWFDLLLEHLNKFQNVRLWFTKNMLLNNPRRFVEYLLVCPSNEVRVAFVKFIANLAHLCLNDHDTTITSSTTTPTLFLETRTPLSDKILIAVLDLLNKENPEFGRTSSHYFLLFYMYISFGYNERAQLLRLNVPCLFLLMILDEAPSTTIKYHNNDMTKCHSVISILLRCCDVRKNCDNSMDDLPLSNIFAEVQNDNYIMELQPQVEDLIYNRTCYIKKLINDMNWTDDCLKLIQFLCWENSKVTKEFMAEIMWHIAYAYCNELKQHIELLTLLLKLEDSWQKMRIEIALFGIPDDGILKNGLFDIAHQSKLNYQKRAYQCVKCLVLTFSKIHCASILLSNNSRIQRQLASLIDWLHDELERRPLVSSPSYGYANWHTPNNSIPSNENNNGYALERTNSARKILEKAMEMLPDGDIDTDELSDEGENSQSEDMFAVEATNVQRPCVRPELLLNHHRRNKSSWPLNEDGENSNWNNNNNNNNNNSSITSNKNTYCSSNLNNRTQHNVTKPTVLSDINCGNSINSNNNNNADCDCTSDNWAESTDGQRNQQCRLNQQQQQSELPASIESSTCTKD